MLNRIKKNDSVIVISGKDRGKQGSVIAINQKKQKIMVKDVNVLTRHVKAKRQGEKSGIIKGEGYIAFSKVMPVCVSCKKACRVSTKFIDDGKKGRSCNRCKETF